jgi:DNA-directed RNA polymerase specialized sigma24 family protein
MAKSEMEKHRDESNDKLSDLKKLLDNLTDEQRKELIDHYCWGCGSKDVSCQCWNDE